MMLFDSCREMCAAMPLFILLNFTNSSESPTVKIINAPLTATVAKAPSAESDFKPYAIPLSADLQRYTYDLCTERGLDFVTVLALMDVESNYTPDLISATNDYGIMQINKCNHGWLRTELGITNFLDVRQNINAGTYMLMNIAKKYSDIHQMLMVYNFGEPGAKKVWNEGIYSSKYSRKVKAVADEIRERR